MRTLDTHANTQDGLGRSLALAVGFALLLIGAGPAQARPYDDTPCHQDANTLCAKERPGSRVIYECLNRHLRRDQLQEECAVHITQQKTERRARADAKKQAFLTNCAADIERLCPDFRHPPFKAEVCLSKRRDELSAQCGPHVGQIGAYRGPGAAWIHDPSETDESRIQRAEELRPGLGGEQMRRKLMLGRMSPEERQAFLKKEREEKQAELAKKAEQEALERAQKEKERAEQQAKALEHREKQRAQGLERREEQRAKAEKRRAERKARREAARAAVQGAVAVPGGALALPAGAADAKAKQEGVPGAAEAGAGADAAPASDED